jgi:hypothetical protein
MRVSKPDKSYQYISADLIEDLRYRGYGGGRIQIHRALLTSPWNGYKLITSAGLAAAFLVGWILVMKWVSALWGWIMAFGCETMGIPSYVTIVHYYFGSLFSFSAPYLYLRSSLPDSAELLIGAVITFVVLIATFFLPRRYVPFIYLIRIVVFFHACALLFFTVVPLAFPYTASGYVHGVLIAGLVLIALIPIVLAFTFFIYDFSLLKKTLLTLLIMLHFTILIPLQYTAHVLVLYHASLLMLPLLFFVFGLPLDVMIFISFYSWGASWKNKLYREPAARGNGFFEDKEKTNGVFNDQET